MDTADKIGAIYDSFIYNQKALEMMRKTADMLDVVVGFTVFGEQYFQLSIVTILDINPDKDLDETQRMEYDKFIKDMEQNEWPLCKLKAVARIMRVSPHNFLLLPFESQMSICEELKSTLMTIRPDLCSLVL